jgi:hypothetical protein
MPEGINFISMAKTTNPRGAGRKPNPEKKERTSFIISPSTFWKIKYASLFSGKNQTELLDEALNKFLDEWEKSNGPIPAPPPVQK